MKNWDYQQDNVYETTFEALTQNPYLQFSTIFDFLGIDVQDNYLKMILKANSFSALKKRWDDKHPGASTGHYRKGGIGDWRSHIWGDLKAHFKEKYGDLLILLGYEADSHW